MMLSMEHSAEIQHTMNVRDQTNCSVPISVQVPEYMHEINDIFQIFYVVFGIFVNVSYVLGAALCLYEMKKQQFLGKIPSYLRGTLACLCFAQLVVGVYAIGEIIVAEKGDFYEGHADITWEIDRTCCFDRVCYRTTETIRKTVPWTRIPMAIFGMWIVYASTLIIDGGAAAISYWIHCKKPRLLIEESELL
jgi:hypothetical protein